MISPTLEYLLLSETQVNDQIMIYLTASISIFFPALKELRIQESLDFNSFSVLSQVLDMVELSEGLIITINDLQFIKRESNY